MLSLLPYVSKQVDLVLKEMEKRGHPMKITSTYRTWAEQDALYEQGRSKPGKKVTNAQGGYSWHNYKVAADLCFTTGDPFGETQPWDMYGTVAQMYGLEWGGSWSSFPDKPHIQMTYGQDITSLRRMGEEKAIAKLHSLDDAHLHKSLGEGDISPWAIASAQKAKAKGIMVNWSAPQSGVDDLTLQYVLQKLRVLEKVDANNPITRERFAVCLDRLKLLD